MKIHTADFKRHQPFFKGRKPFSKYSHLQFFEFVTFFYFHVNKQTLYRITITSFNYTQFSSGISTANNKTSQQKSSYQKRREKISFIQQSTTSLSNFNISYFFKNFPNWILMLYILQIFSKIFTLDQQCLNDFSDVLGGKSIKILLKTDKRTMRKFNGMENL